MGGFCDAPRRQPLGRVVSRVSKSSLYKAYKEVFFPKTMLDDKALCVLCDKRLQQKIPLPEEAQDSIVARLMDLIYDLPDKRGRPKLRIGHEVERRIARGDDPTEARRRLARLSGKSMKRVGELHRRHLERLAKKP